MKKFLILLILILIPLASATAPTISLANNSKTHSAATEVFMDNNEKVTFNVTSNQAITSWVWFLDGVFQSNNNPSFNTTQTGRSYHIVTVFGANVNGNSNTLKFGVTTFQSMASPSSTAIQLNETPANDIRDAMTSFSLKSIIISTTEPYTNELGSYFFLIIWVIIVIMIAIKQNSVFIPSIIGVLFGGVMLTFVPEQYILPAQGLVVLGMMFTVYMFFKGRN